MAEIRDFYNKTGDVKIYPRTVCKAVINSEGVDLETLLKKPVSDIYLSTAYDEDPEYDDVVKDIT